MGMPARQLRRRGRVGWVVQQPEDEQRAIFRVLAAGGDLRRELLRQCVALALPIRYARHQRAPLNAGTQPLYQPCGCALYLWGQCTVRTGARLAWWGLWKG